MMASKEWLEMEKKVNTITDALGQPVDTGIKDLVITLNLLGFITSGSCEGHLEYGEGPYVDIEIDAASDFDIIYDNNADILSKKFKNARKRVDMEVSNTAEKILNYLQEFYKDRNVFEKSRIIIDCHISIRIQPQGAKLILMEKNKKDLLDGFQKEFKDFTKFLKSKLS